LPPYGDYFRHEIARLGNAPCDDALCNLDGLAAGSQPPFVFTDQLNQDLVAGLDTRRPNGIPLGSQCGPAG